MTVENNNVDLKGCSDDDVISLSRKFYKVENIKTGLNNFLFEESNNMSSASHNLSNIFKSAGISINSDESLALLTNGTDSEILKVASNGWKKGKLKLKMTIEFIPDEPEIQDESESNQYISPLDEIRNHPSFPNS
jgi:hypothetical protein